MKNKLIFNIYLLLLISHILFFVVMNSYVAYWSLEDLNVEDVDRLLDSLSLDKYKPIFRKHRVTGRKLDIAMKRT